ncbi:MAG: TIGR03619 family F420-dependent LLM class oxidoreductase [Candidatus Binatia bacterium]
MSKDHEMATLGVGVEITDRTIGIGKVARLTSERGYSSIFVSEHTHVPVDSRSVSPTGVPRDWVKRMPDPYVTLAAAAATTDLEVGTSVALLAEHEPVVLAKAIATLDQLSGGRFVLGVGWGWHREEFENITHKSPHERVAMLIENLAAMRRLWTDEEAEYIGKYVQIRKSWSWPKPARPGGPPVLLGAPGTTRNFQRIVAWADGWIPQMSGLDSEVFPAQLDALRRLWREAGRAASGPDITVFHPPGSADDVRRGLERASQLGIKRVLVRIIEERMKDFEAIVDAVAPAIPGR